ncbi:MAG TPA: DUF1080 domain-containing protein [Gemmataceae bacterium]
MPASDNKRFVLIAITVTSIALLPSLGRYAAAADPEGFRPLFNGKDLSGWDTWLGRPHPSVTGLDLKKNDKGQYVGTVGLNKDPKNVYTVVTEDGAPAIRISGEIFGALTSKEEFSDYHLRLQFKWGEKKWPPRDKAKRDSGLLYHCVGEHGAGGTFWMRSLECQIQEGDCGDFWSVAGVLVDVEGELQGDNGPVVFRPGGKTFTLPAKGLGNRAVKSATNEKPHGQWNTIEVYCVGPTSVHVVNGTPNMVLTNARVATDGGEKPLARGKIQLQSEGAEVFYRNIEVRPIKEIPKELLK